MPTNRQLNKAFMLRNALEVGVRLRAYRHANGIRIRMARNAMEMDTDGWSIAIGYLEKNGPRLEIWLDRFSGHKLRKLYAGVFFSKHENPTTVIKHVQSLWPVRTITDKDTVDHLDLELAMPLRKSEFKSPVLERYQNGPSYFGIYHSTLSQKKIDSGFCQRAVGFFEDIAFSLPNSRTQGEDRNDYSKTENRKLVASHVRRERSGYLAAECKIRDGYSCQVCRKNFEDVYGEIGVGFAEAHHIVALSKLRGPVKTRLVDLITVCADCHRMLHRMTGVPNDIKKLKTIIRRNKK